MQILKFTSKSCQPCKTLTKNMEGWGLGVKQYVGEIDIEGDFETAAKYRVRSVPTMIVIGDDGVEIARYSGANISEESIGSHLVV